MEFIFSSTTSLPKTNGTLIWNDTYWRKLGLHVASIGIGIFSKPRPCLTWLWYIDLKWYILVKEIGIACGINVLKIFLLEREREREEILTFPKPGAEYNSSLHACLLDSVFSTPTLASLYQMLSLYVMGPWLKICRLSLFPKHIKLTFHINSCRMNI